MLYTIEYMSVLDTIPKVGTKTSSFSASILQVLISGHVKKRLSICLSYPEIQDGHKTLIAPIKREVSDEDIELSDTAKNTLTDFQEMKSFAEEIIADIYKEADSISQDQRLYADYLCGLKEFKPWLECAQKNTVEPLRKPITIDEALELLSSCEQFKVVCGENKEKLDGAAQAREQMEKASTTENESESLGTLLQGVEKIAVTRIEKVATLVNTWKELRTTTEDLAGKMNEVPKQDNPNIEELEKVFISMKDLFAKKKELLLEV